MPIAPVTITNAFANLAGQIRLSLLDTDFDDLATFANTTLNYSNYLVDTGAANAYVVTYTGGLTFTLTAGQMVQVKITNANTGACTLAVNGTTATAIKLQDGTDPAANTLVANGVYQFLYTGTSWMLLGMSPGAVTGTSFQWLQFAIGDQINSITTGTKFTTRFPACTVLAVRASLQTTSSSGLPTFNIKKGGTTILSTLITIDVGETTSTTAVTPPVISVPTIADDSEMTFTIDVAGTGAKGPIVTMQVRWT